jgi:glycosyltransferase involved in cell wall biosynthesis
MENPIKVLQVISSLGMGGAETWLVELVKHWHGVRKGRIAVDFLVTRGETDVFDSEILTMCSNIHYANLDRWSVPQFSSKLRRLLNQGQYDAIHDHQDFLSGWHFALAGSHAPPVRIAHFHNPSYQLYENYGVNPRRKLILALGRCALRHYATEIIGTSRQLLNEYGITKATFSRQNPRPLHCAFNIERWQGNQQQARAFLLEETGWDSESKIVIFVGRLDPFEEIHHPRNHKNSAFALSVFGAAYAEDKDLRLLYVGAHQGYKEQFQSCIDARELGGAVQMLGVRKDVERLMLGSDMLLFPSRAEGLGMVAVEAQASGLPVLASEAVPKECVVLPEMVTFLSLDRPHPEWANAILGTLRKPRSSPTGHRAEWKKSPFNIEVCAGELERLYANADDSALPVP